MRHERAGEPAGPAGVRVRLRVHVVRARAALPCLPGGQPLRSRGWFQVTDYEDDLSPSAAVAAAETGATAWREAVHAQLSAAPDHSEFYAVTAEVVDTLRSISGMAGVLGRQVEGYGEGRELRDDAGADPAERLADASAELALARDAVDSAERAVNRFWSQIGHIAVEYRADEDEAADGGPVDSEGDGS
jgi:hypothetical protein